MCRARLRLPPVPRGGGRGNTEEARNLFRAYCRWRALDRSEARPFSGLDHQDGALRAPPPSGLATCPSPANCRQASRRTPSPRPAASPPRIRGWVDATQPVPEPALQGRPRAQPYPPPALNHSSARDVGERSLACLPAESARNLSPTPNSCGSSAWRAGSRNLAWEGVPCGTLTPSNLGESGLRRRGGSGPAGSAPALLSISDQTSAVGGLAGCVSGGRKGGSQGGEAEYKEPPTHC